MPYHNDVMNDPKRILPSRWLFRGVCLVVFLSTFLPTVWLLWRAHYLRNTAALSSCIAGLKQIDGAKEQWALEMKRTTGDPVTWGNLVPDFIKNQPACICGGVYTANAIGEAPTCSLAREHSLPAEEVAGR